MRVLRGAALGVAMAAVLCGVAACGPAGGDAKQQAESPVTPAPQGPQRHILAFGDSLFAGYGLRAEQAYPVRLGAALRGQGINAVVTNASVSGDTTADGLARLQFTLAGQNPQPDLVMICLGGNDMLRGLPPQATRANLDAMLTALDRRHIRVLLMGMLAAPNMGKPYAAEFNAIYPTLARKHHAALVPFFLSAVIDHPELRQADHIHPTASGVDALVQATQGAARQGLGAAR